MKFLKNATCPFTGLLFNGTIALDDNGTGTLQVIHPATHDYIEFEVVKNKILIPLDLLNASCLLPSNKVAEILNIKRSMIRKLEREGKLHAKSVDGRKYYNFDEVLQYKLNRRPYRKGD